MSVGLVIVSHSEKIATGITELARQMAPNTRLLAAGGMDDGRIGTSFDRVTAAIAEAADDGGGVVVLCDLGSAVLTAETALDLADDDVRERVRIADAPIVEGAVAAAVAAETGADVAAVLAAAETARGGGSSSVSGDTAATRDAVPLHPLSEAPVSSPASGSATLVNREGLHARPASEFVRLASRFDARVTVNGMDAKSLLRIMALGLSAGSEVSIEATGGQAHEAVDALVALVRSGFGEDTR